MTDMIDNQKITKHKLLPFQEDLVNNYLKNDSARIIEYSLPVGTEKSQLIIEIVNRLGYQSRSILFLVPNLMLLDQYRYLFEESKIHLEPIVVDRRRFLDFESASENEKGIWPLKSIIIMSMGLANRKDIRASLTNNKWDLVIFDESHLLSGQRLDLYQHLSKYEVTNRVLLLAESPLSSGISDIERIVVKLEDVTNWSGEHLHHTQRRKIEHLHYMSTPEEVQLYVETKSFINTISEIYTTGKILSNSLGKSALSSNYALEVSLRRILKRLQEISNLFSHHKGSEIGISSYIKKKVQKIIAEEDLELLNSMPDKELIPEKFILLLDRANRLIDLLEEIETDRKLDALIEYLNDTVNKGRVTHLCILTSFSSTAEYLWAILDDAFPMVYLITGVTSPEDRFQAINEFDKRGGILISTDASTKGFELTFVDQCISYDIPKNYMAMEIRWSRFDRFGRTKSFKMIDLLDDNKIFDELDA